MGGLKLPIYTLPSISKSALMLSPCTAWARPGTAVYKEEYINAKERDDGTVFHKEIWNYINNRPYSYGLSTQVRNWLCKAEVFVSQIRDNSEQLYSELCVGINWSTGEAVPLFDVQDRNYPNEPVWRGWQFGTADLVCIKNDGSLFVGDWKTGPQGGQTGAKEQLLSLGYGFREVFRDVNGCHRPLTTSCLQVNEEGIWPHDEVISNETLNAHRDSMGFVTSDFESGVYSHETPGVHCTMFYCPHLAYCDSVLEFVTALATGPNSSGNPPVSRDDMNRYNITDSPKSSEEAGFTQAMISAANRQTKYLTEANKQRFRRGDSVESGNWVWEDRGNGFRWYRKNGDTDV